MWPRIVHFILQNRILLIILLLGSTLLISTNLKHLKTSRKFIQIVPDEDPDYRRYEFFDSLFGKQSGKLFALSLEDENIYRLSNFKILSELIKNLEAIDGVDLVLGLPNIVALENNVSAKKFEMKPLFDPFPSSQKVLDSLLEVAYTLKLYENRLWNPQNKSLLILININPEVDNSMRRDKVTKDIITYAHTFTKETKIDFHYGGLPYIRSIMTTTVEEEIVLFIALSFSITFLTLLLFFRSFSASFYPMILILILIVWVMSILGAFGYELTILTVLLPSVLIIIAIPNCIYMINKYHQQFIKYRSKEKALVVTIQKIGMIMFISNTTTAIGFLVLLYTRIPPIMEFGIVAGLNILITFVISLIFIPIVLSYLPAPRQRHIKHLDFKLVNSLIAFFEATCKSEENRKIVYITTLGLLLIAVWGMFKINTISYMVDDLPESSRVMEDLAFLESNFKGVLPFEIIIDTHKKRGYRNLKYLKLIDELQTELENLPYLSKALSITTFLKAANQAFFEDSSRYTLPNRYVQNIVLRNLKNQDQDANSKIKINNLIDSTGRYIRLSMQISDLGSDKIKQHVENTINPLLDSVLRDSPLEAKPTGTAFIFFKGNNFLVKNLKNSILLAFVLIGILMGLMFKNVRIILISLVTNLIPLILTAGLMGWLGIPLKPSTTLAFSIAFGISIDDSIHFLAKYKQELRINNPNAILTSLHETGVSMFYTSVVLFLGFIIFTGSNFGGTVLLGFLCSITLLFAMVSNLIILPSLLWSFDAYPKLKEN